MLISAAREEKLPVVTELMSADKIGMFLEKKVDLIQIGARNMQNFDLLKAVGRLHVPVLLKRGMSATIEEWLMSAEYIMSEGNHNVILCERGIRTFEKATRNTLDLSAVAAVKAHEPPADHRRSEPRDRPPLDGRVHGHGSDRCRCRWHHVRGT